MKAIFDYDGRFCIRPFKAEKKEILYYTFHKNFFNFSAVKKEAKKDMEIYCTKSFKNSSPYINAFFKNYDASKNQSFEALCFENMDIILKSIPLEIKSLGIYCKKNDDRIKKIIQSAVNHSDTIYLFTEDANFFDEINSYAIKSYGTGLLKNEKKECDVVIILNERITDFFKKGRYVVNLQKGHTVFNCNLLWDFYDEKAKKIDTKGIKKSFFTEKSPIFLKLKWKIPKKSWQIPKKVYNRIYSYV